MGGCRAQLHGPFVMTGATTAQNVGVAQPDITQSPFLGLPVFLPTADNDRARLILKITAISGGSVTPVFYGVMSDGVTKVKLNAALTQSAPGTFVYEIAQNGGAVSGDVVQSTQRSLPTNLLVAIEPAGATFTATAWVEIG